MDMATLGIAAFTFAVTGMVFIATTARGERYHLECRSMSLDRVDQEPALDVLGSNGRPTTPA